jgi:hypothetical protein
MIPACAILRGLFLSLLGQFRGGASGLDVDFQAHDIAVLVNADQKICKNYPCLSAALYLARWQAVKSFSKKNGQFFRQISLVKVTATLYINFNNQKLPLCVIHMGF